MIRVSKFGIVLLSIIVSVVFLTLAFLENRLLAPLGISLLVIGMKLKNKKVLPILSCRKTCKIVFIILLGLLSVFLLQRSYKKFERFKYSIFFFEANISRPVFSPKQMCAIESAARNNPEALVKVYSFRAKLDPEAGFLASQYNNIQIQDINMESVLEGTAMLPWWNTGVMIKSKYGYSHVTDLLRCEKKFF